MKEAGICLSTYGSLNVSHWKAMHNCNLETILRLEFIPCFIQRAKNRTGNHPLFGCCGGRYLANNHSQHSISLRQGLYPLTLSGCTFAIPFIYCILTLFGSTSSAIPIFFHSASGHNTISRLLSSARRLSALPPFHIATLASTESASANFSSSAFSAAAFAARSRLTA